MARCSDLHSPIYWLTLSCLFDGWIMISEQVNTGQDARFPLTVTWRFSSGTTVYTLGPNNSTGDGDANAVTLDTGMLLKSMVMVCCFWGKLYNKSLLVDLCQMPSFVVYYYLPQRSKCFIDSGLSLTGCFQVINFIAQSLFKLKKCMYSARYAGIGLQVSKRPGYVIYSLASCTATCLFFPCYLLCFGLLVVLKSSCSAVVWLKGLCLISHLEHLKETMYIEDILMRAWNKLFEHLYM